jgi:hypothetical protein
MSSPSPLIVWFRQDLRLADNPALSAAVATGAPIVPVHILDDEGAGAWRRGGASRWWLHHSLAALGADLHARGAPLVLPAGFRLAAHDEVRTGAALVGQTVLYCWPDEGWVRGTVVRRSRTSGFSHVVRYGRTSALGLAEVPSLLAEASHCPAGRWVLLRRAR